MPLTVKHINEGRGVAYTASGHLAGSEAIKAVTEVEAAESASHSILFAFFDFDSVTGVDISTAQLRELADIAIDTSKRGAKRRVVAIYARDDLPFALSRMWIVFAEHAGWETAVFRKRPEAVAWVRERVSTKFGATVELD